MQYTEIFSAVKIKISLKKYSFNNFAQNIKCVHTLQPLRRRGSNEYPESMFRAKIRKRYPLKSQVFQCNSVDIEPESTP